MKFLPVKLTDEELLSRWPEVLASRSYCTAHEAMKYNSNPGYNTFVVGLARARLRTHAGLDNSTDTVADHLAVNFNYDQIMDILQGRNMHSVGAFAAATCSCKSKSQVVSNFALRPLALRDRDPWDLALTGRVMFNEDGLWQDTSDFTSLQDLKPAPFNKFSQRLQMFKAPTLSIMARCTCFNTYVVSVMPYTASYFGLSTPDLNTLRQQAAKFILKRHWLESEILPYVLRSVGIAPVLDPALVATVAATGLYFREGNTLEDLVNMNLHPGGCNLRQRSVVHDLLLFWSPFVKLHA